MFKKILVPLDLTTKHERVIATAAELAQQSGGEVILLHVVEIMNGLSQQDEPTFYSRLERTARVHLQKYGESLAARQIVWSERILCGHRAQEVARQAQETAADLIITTSPRIDPDNPALGWGSLSWKIGILAPCPVLLIK